jgi:hypothetical protein
MSTDNYPSSLLLFTHLYGILKDPPAVYFADTTIAEYLPPITGYMLRRLAIHFCLILSYMILGQMNPNPGIENNKLILAWFSTYMSIIILLMINDNEYNKLKKHNHIARDHIGQIMAFTLYQQDIALSVPEQKRNELANAIDPYSSEAAAEA